MSNKLQTQVWDLDMRPAGKKLTLQAFADQANNDGVAWIAVQSVQGKRDLLRMTSLSLRALQGHIQDLETEGHLERLPNCLWIVRATPAGLAGVWAADPAEIAADPANSAGIPSSIPNEREIGARVAPPVDKCPLSAMPLPPGLSLEQWEGYLDMRFAIGKPLRPYSSGILIQRLQDMSKRWVVGDVVDRATVNNWSNILEPEEGRVTGLRRVVAGTIAEPVGGLRDEERVELRRIDAIQDVGEQLAAKRDFFAAQERRNAPVAVGKLVGRLAGELNLGPPKAGKRKGANR